MSKAVILQHAAYQGPGRIVSVFRDFGIPTEVRHLYRGDDVPSDLEEIRVLVVLGGPLRVADVGDGRYPFLAKEVETLSRLVAQDRPVLGIELGAQLLAQAAGAKVYPNVKPGASPQDSPTPMPEYGWGPVTFPFPGGTDPLIFGLSDGTPMLHFHAETFDLPKLAPPPNAPPAPPLPTGVALLSSSKICKNQAFRFKNRLIGFQYHIELTEQGIDDLLSGRRDELTASGTSVEAIREQTPRHYPRYQRLTDRILENFVQFLKAY